MKLHALRGRSLLGCCLVWALALSGIWAAVWAGEAKPGWQLEWERTLQAAEREGQVTVYIAGYGDIIDAGEFQRAFPRIRVVSVTGSGSQLAPRLAAERRAGKFLADVYGGGGNSLYQFLYVGKMLDPIKPGLILPEVVDPSHWWEGKHKYVDSEGGYIFVYEANVSAGATPGYNTKAVNPGEFRSYWDFVNPRWKGKMAAVDIRQVRGAGLMWQYMYYHPDLGPEFIRRLYGGMDVTMTGDLRQAVDWLATGKFALCIPCRDVTDAKNQGLPVDTFEPYHFKEGVSISSAFGQIALMNRAPHPHAAKVFVNWLLSRAGQALFQKVMSQPGSEKNSRRVDVPKNHIPRHEQRREGMKYFDPDRLEVKDLTPVIKLVAEVLAKR